MKNKGFTLIELAVVLLVIGILAGIVLKNVGSQGSQARDTRRVSDLRNVSVYLAQYLSKTGSFPDTTDTDWVGSTGTLAAALVDKGVIASDSALPKPPSGASYQYYACTDSGDNTISIANHFVLRVILEEDDTKNARLYDSAYNGSTLPWTTGGCAVKTGGSVIGTQGSPGLAPSGSTLALSQNISCLSKSKEYCLIQ
ncbi:MAG: prepilin-type N-terminal cleavage/methylation domain-containing protein [Patescibacteria group bacterium]